MTDEHPEISGVLSSDEFKDFKEEWASFLDKFGDFVVETESPLYRIPYELLDLLSNWIKPQDLEFETALTELCDRYHSVGVLPDRVIPYTLLDPVEPIMLSPELFKELNWDKSMTLDHAKSSIRNAGKYIDELNIQQKAYVGWLITEPTFLEEVESLKSLENTHCGLNNSDEERQQAITEYNVFCNRWQLMGMATWELPLPQGVNISDLPLPNSVVPHATMTNLQLPATMRLPSRFPLPQILKKSRHSNSTDNLDGWQKILDHEESGNKLGIQGFCQMMELHFYRNIVLPSRHSDRIRKNVALLDEKFGVFLGGVSSDSIKRIRSACNRRLQT